MESYLAPQTNIIRFQREAYLYPVPKAGGRGMMNRAFGGPVADLDKAPGDTSLRRAAIAHLKKNGHWYNGGMLLFPQNMDWGRQVYRQGEETRKNSGE